MEDSSRHPIGSDAYNDEPIYYCKHCLSLAIKDIGIGDICCDCGSTAIGKAQIWQYDLMYESKYGTKVFNK